jgi:hypothetical protein
MTVRVPEHFVERERSDSPNVGVVWCMAGLLVRPTPSERANFVERQAAGSRRSSTPDPAIGTVARADAVTPALPRTSIV